MVVVDASDKDTLLFLANDVSSHIYLYLKVKKKTYLSISIELQTLKLYIIALPIKLISVLVPPILSFLINLLNFKI